MKHRPVAALAATLTALIGVAACSPGSGSSQATASSPAASGSASSSSLTSVTSAPVTLTLATSEAAGMTPSLISGFEKLHPNIKIKLDQASFNDYQQSINLELQSSTAPDIALVNLFGNQVKDNLLLNLDNYAGAYGWTSKLSPSALSPWRVQADGLTQGNGNLYALPGGFSVVGLFWNKTLAAKLGITSAPATIADMVTDMSKAHAAGIAGLETAAGDGHAAFNIQAVAEQYATPTALNNWIFGVSGSQFNTSAVQQGVTDLAQWAKDGYLNTSANATSLTQAVADFGAGKALFLYDGSWDAVAIDKALNTAAGFAPYPTATAGQPVNGMSGAVAYAIAAHSSHPNEAAAFLDYMISAQAGQGVLSAGFLPVNTTDVTAPTAPDMVDTLTAWNAITKSGDLYGFLAGATGTMNATLTQTTQELIAGKITSSSLITQVQTDWSQAHH